MELERNAKKHIIDAAMARTECDLVLKNAKYVNVFSNELLEGDIAITDGIIVGIGTYTGKKELDLSGKIICPGFIDSHMHLESSLVTPKELAKIAIPHGTAVIVTDPHEITNVMGTDGIDYLLQATEGLPIDIRFMVPSCVPSTPFDESGAELLAADNAPYYDKDRVIGLAEMMNAFGVVHNDESVLDKIVGAQAKGRPIDGHAPGLSSEELNAYAAAGVTSDHECSVLEEGLEKLRVGQYIMIREGTAARNLKALAPLLQPQYADRCLLCTDDKHPSDLLELGHIDGILRLAVKEYGADPISAVKAATFNSAQYFGLTGYGAVAPGYKANLAIVSDLTDFNVEIVLKDGEVVSENGSYSAFEEPVIDKRLAEHAENTFFVGNIKPSDFISEKPLGIIGMVPGEIITTDEGRTEKADIDADILQVAVIERHKNTGHIGLGFMKGYGLKRGAVATSISHDSHNIIVIGTNPEDMAFAANRIVENHGGIVVAENGAVKSEVVLEIAGIMSNQPLTKINLDLETSKNEAYALGVSRGIDPFMTLSFMALTVIPTLRINTIGVFDAVNQCYVE